MIRIELAKQWRRPRTLVTFAALASFTLVLTVALAASGGNQFQRVGDIPLFIVPDRSGISVPVIALASTMKFFLPLAVAGPTSPGSEGTPDSPVFHRRSPACSPTIAWRPGWEHSA